MAAAIDNILLHAWNCSGMVSVTISRIAAIAGWIVRGGEEEVRTCLSGQSITCQRNKSFSEEIFPSSLTQPSEICLKLGPHLLCHRIRGCG